MTFIDTDLRLKRASGEISSSATAARSADESKINVLFDCISQVYGRRFWRNAWGSWLALLVFSFVIIFMSYWSLTFEEMIVNVMGQQSHKTAIRYRAAREGCPLSFVSFVAHLSNWKLQFQIWFNLQLSHTTNSLWTLSFTAWEHQNALNKYCGN